MTNLTVQYMGIELDNPLIASSSPLTASPERIEELAAAGIGGVVLKSIFEEQISGKAEMLERYNDYPEASDYLQRYVGSDYLQGFDSLIKDVKTRGKLPVIASINCTSTGKWMDFARQIEQAGADALELNIYYLPTMREQTSAEIEERYLDIVEKVAASVSIPVSVKLSMRFTNILNMMQQLYNRGAKGVVLYNKFFEPDIDIQNMEYVQAEPLSHPSELHNTLRNVAVASSVISGLDISVSRGVHSGADVVKSILAGAHNVQLCSTLLLNGTGVISEMKKFISEWMDRNGSNYVSDFRGLMNSKVRLDDPMLDRVQYMKYFPGERD